VSVLLGNGDGTFQPAQSFAAGFSPSSVVVGDFNGDGRPDLAVANAGLDTGYGSTVSVLLGNVDGTFQPARNFDTNNYGRSVAVGDFNGDGRLDLAVANASSNDGSVMIDIIDVTYNAATVSKETGVGASRHEADFVG